MSSDLPKNTEYDYLSPCRPLSTTPMGPPTRFVRRKGKTNHEESKLAQSPQACPHVDTLTEKEVELMIKELTQLMSEWKHLTASLE
jgi:hypothetical protein